MDEQQNTEVVSPPLWRVVLAVPLMLIGLVLALLAFALGEREARYFLVAALIVLLDGVALLVVRSAWATAVAILIALAPLGMVLLISNVCLTCK